jgi:SNF2 family DNA or RNA helicase
MLRSHIAVEKKYEYEVVYNLSEFVEGLYLPTAYIVSQDQDGLLAHIQQKAIEETIGSFDLELDPIRKQLFHLIEQLQPKNLEKKFNPTKKRIKPLEKLLEIPDLKKTIQVYVHRRLDELLSLVVHHQLPICWHLERKVLVKDFLMEPMQEVLQPHLSFKKTDSKVVYQLKLSEKGEVRTISSHDVFPITNHPAWIFVDYRLYKVSHINGNMVKPFRNKDVIYIPEDKVKTYFQKFIVRVASKVDIEAEGFGLVHFNRLKGCRLEAVHDLFNDGWGLAVNMRYSNTEFTWNDPKKRRTTLEFGEEEVRILQVNRDKKAEQQFIDKLGDFGLIHSGGNFFNIDKSHDDEWHLLEWLANHKEALEAEGFVVEQALVEDQQQVYLYKPSLQMMTEQKNDWFDIHGEVTVGEFTFPFMKLAKHIKDGNRLYRLPNGTYFLIPQEWMSKYRPIANFAKKEGLQLRLNKNQFTLLQDLGVDEPPTVSKDLDSMEFEPSPQLRAELRPYQLEGVKWLVQLYQNGLGACLADDMGLGKTLQTITVLLHAKEQKEQQSSEASDQESIQLQLFQSQEEQAFLSPLNALIILPASLVFNWEREIQKFAPSLTVYRHVGPKRHKDIRILVRYDVVLTTYQTALRDVEILEQIDYEYIVLDESQQIKNRESKIFKAINRLRANHKVSLSGTPIENSLSDIWSQMQFINPDLLGSFSFFKKEFITPIEKRQDEDKTIRLRRMVAPYVLRRTKEEVARDLPPLTTQLFYTEMTKEQKRLYEKEKSAARNFLLDNYAANNPQYRIMVLRSLTKLRQIVNHPVLVTDQYKKDSGKFNDIIELWNVIRKSGHKVLFFSSFVQYLQLFRQQFEKDHQAYSMLTGDMSNKERDRQIQRFAKEEDIQSFLISIKSGGTGLNLVAADYVFLLDPWWNPTTEQQAIARAHRIGQDKNVFAIKFITRDSIEEKILKLQERKSKLAEEIIESVKKSSLSKGEIEYLLE